MLFMPHLTLLIQYVDLLSDAWRELENKVDTRYTPLMGKQCASIFVKMYASNIYSYQDSVNLAPIEF